MLFPLSRINNTRVQFYFITFLLKKNHFQKFDFISFFPKILLFTVTWFVKTHVVVELCNCGSRAAVEKRHCSPTDTETFFVCVWFWWTDPFNLLWTRVSWENVFYRWHCRIYSDEILFRINVALCSLFILFFMIMWWISSFSTYFGSWLIFLIWSLCWF